MIESLAALSLTAWIYLCFCQGRFWTTSERLEDGAPEPDSWPEVVAIVPARDEEDVIESSIGSLLRQAYAGRFTVILADDESQDRTAERASMLEGSDSRLEICRTPERPAGWVGKMWAVHTGVLHAQEHHPGATYLLLTDADIEHSPGNLAALVRRAERDRLDLTSLMVKLDASHGWSRLLIPSFVYFFSQLYPFARVNNPTARTAGAAGGCMLVRREALDRIGGMETLKSEVIDDCAMGRALKAQGPIWLGHTTSEKSIRPYTGLGEIWAMVARSAYTQLDYRPVFAAGTLAGLSLLFVIPVLAVILGLVTGQSETALLGLSAWTLMAATFLPTLALYHRGPVASLWALTLPLAGILYGAMTLDSVRRHMSGRGAEWKGRVGAGAAEARTMGLDDANHPSPTQPPARPPEGPRRPEGE